MRISSQYALCIVRSNGKLCGGRQYLNEATDLHSPLQRLVRPEQYKTYSLVPNEAFSQRHYQSLVEHLQLSYKRLPSDSTLRRALMGVDFAQLAQAFVAWAKPYLDLNKSRWFAIDGKGLNGSTTALCEAYQQLICQYGLAYGRLSHSPLILGRSSFLPHTSLRNNQSQHLESIFVTPHFGTDQQNGC